MFDDLLKYWKHLDVLNVSTVKNIYSGQGNKYYTLHITWPAI